MTQYFAHEALIWQEDVGLQKPASVEAGRSFQFHWSDVFHVPMNYLLETFVARKPDWLKMIANDFPYELFFAFMAFDDVWRHISHYGKRDDKTRRSKQEAQI